MLINRSNVTSRERWEKKRKRRGKVGALRFPLGLCFLTVIRSKQDHKSKPFISNIYSLPNYKNKNKIKFFFNEEITQIPLPSTSNTSPKKSKCANTEKPNPNIKSTTKQKDLINTRRDGEKENHTCNE